MLDRDFTVFSQDLGEWTVRVLTKRLLVAEHRTDPVASHRPDIALLVRLMGLVLRSCIVTQIWIAAGHAGLAHDGAGVLHAPRKTGGRERFPSLGFQCGLEILRRPLFIREHVCESLHYILTVNRLSGL